MSRSVTINNPVPASAKRAALSQKSPRRKRSVKPVEGAAPSSTPLTSVSHVYIYPSVAVEGLAYLRLRMALAGQKLRFDSATASAILQDMVGSALSPGTESHLEDELVTGETRHARRSHQIEVLRQAGIPDDRVAGVWAIAQPTACETKTVGRVPAELRLASMARQLGKRDHERFTFADGHGVVWAPSKSNGFSGDEFFHLFIKSDGSEIVCHRYPGKRDDLEARSFADMRDDLVTSISAECLTDALNDLGYWPSSDFKAIDGDRFDLFDCLNRDVLDILAAAHAPTSSLYGTLVRVCDEGGNLCDLVSRHPLLVDLLHFELPVELSNPVYPIRMLELAIEDTDARAPANVRRPTHLDLAPIQHVTPRAAHGFGSAHLGHLVRFGHDRAPRTENEWDSFLNFYGVITGSQIELALAAARENAQAAARLTRNFDAIDWVGRVQDCVEGLRKLPGGLAWHRGMSPRYSDLKAVLQSLEHHCESMFVVKMSTAHITRPSSGSAPAPINSRPAGPLGYPSTVLDVDGNKVEIAIISDKSVDVLSAELFIPDLISETAHVHGRLLIKNGVVAQNNLVITDASTTSPIPRQTAKAVCDRFAASVAASFTKLSAQNAPIMAEAMAAYDLRKKKRFEASASVATPNAAAQARKVSELRRDLLASFEVFNGELDRLGLSQHRALFAPTH